MQYNMVCITYHGHYQPEQFSDLRYDVHPKDHVEPEGKCFVVPFYDGNEFIDWNDLMAPRQADISLSLNDDDKEYHDGCHDPLNELTLYRIHADDEGITKFLKKMVKMMIDRIDWVLYSEDHHSDFYHSTLEFMFEVAQRTYKEHLLEPLQRELEANFEKNGCPYCSGTYYSCHLLKVLADGRDC